MDSEILLLSDKVWTIRFYERQAKHTQGLSLLLCSNLWYKGIEIGRMSVHELS